MKHRTNIVALALLLSALVVPASQAGERRSPDVRNHAAAQAGSQAFAGLGHEGSGLRKSKPAVNAFANLGHEGSGLLNGTSPIASSALSKWETRALRPWAN